MDETACEDLKAFERRFTEIIAVKQPAAGRWRILLVVTSVCTAIGAYQWLSDPTTMDAGFLESLGSHLFFTVSLIILLILFFGCGIHKRVVAPSIIASRCRSVLSDFNLSCDDRREEASFAFPALISVSISMQVLHREFLVEPAVAFQHVLLAVVSVFVVCGGTLPYIFQYHEIKKSQNARGFSLFVCLTLLAANILRVMFWLGKYFELQLLFQSLVMIFCMLLMVRLVVLTRRKHILPPQRLYSIWSGELYSHFWAWNDVSSYLVLVGMFTLGIAILTNIFVSSPLYVEGLGFLSLFLEANLGTPQLLNNFSRKSTLGMSLRMVMLWFLGDVSKTVYFLVRETPVQFWLCGLYQIGMDIAILGQLLLFGRSIERLLLKPIIMDGHVKSVYIFIVTPYALVHCVTAGCMGSVVIRFGIVAAGVVSTKKTKSLNYVP